MKTSVLRFVSDKECLLSLNKCLYVLTRQQGSSMRIKTRHEFEAPVRFVVLDNLVGISNDNDKLLRFYDLARVLNEANLGEPRFQYKSWKKITYVAEASVKEHGISGVLIADKTGDIFFLNEANLERLAKDPETVPTPNSEEAENFDFVAKLIYGHQ